MNPYEAPNALHELPATPDNGPPASVRTAVGCFAVSYLSGILKTIYLFFHEAGAFVNWSLWVVFGLVTGFMCLWLRGLYRGRKWAYVFWIISVTGSLLIICFSPTKFRGAVTPTEWQKVFSVAQSIVQLIATLLLAMPVSWRWFFPGQKRNAPDETSRPETDL